MIMRVLQVVGCPSHNVLPFIEHRLVSPEGVLVVRPNVFRNLDNACTSVMVFQCLYNPTLPVSLLQIAPTLPARVIRLPPPSVGHQPGSPGKRRQIGPSRVAGMGHVHEDTSPR